MLHAEVMELLGPRMSSHSSQLDIDYPASFKLDRGLGMGGIVNAFVQADGCAQSSLQQGMLIYVVPGQGLLDHHEVMLIQRLE